MVFTIIYNGIYGGFLSMDVTVVLTLSPSLLLSQNGRRSPGTVVRQDHSLYEKLSNFLNSGSTSFNYTSTSFHIRKWSRYKLGVGVYCDPYHFMTPVHVSSGEGVLRVCLRITGHKWGDRSSVVTVNYGRRYWWWRRSYDWRNGILDDTENPLGRGVFTDKID